MIEYIEREITATIREASQYFPVICITGPRQSGKSTLIRHLFSDYKRYSLEDYDVRSYAQHDPVAFLRQNANGMVIDEVQRVPELLSYIQGIVDDDPQKKFVLSGSSNFLLLRSVSQSLAGRAGVFDLLPMSYAETAEYQAEKSLDAVLFEGLYPAIVSGKNVPKFLYPSYVRTYLEKDVRELINVRDISQFHTFLRLCAGRIGSVFNASELANEGGVAVNTIQSWLSILEASYVVYRLLPWSDNSRKRLTKSPKIYFCDTGLACHLLGIETPEQLSRDKMRGHLFENFIVMEALKHRLNQGAEPNLYFYRDAKQEEIDLILQDASGLRGFEIKSSMTYNSAFEKTLRKMPSLVTPPVVKRSVIYAGDLVNDVAEISVQNFRNISW